MRTIIGAHENPHYLRIDASCRPGAQPRPGTRIRTAVWSPENLEWQSGPGPAAAFRHLPKERVYSHGPFDWAATTLTWADLADEDGSTATTAAWPDPADPLGWWTSDELAAAILFALQNEAR